MFCFYRLFKPLFVFYNMSYTKKIEVKLCNFIIELDIKCDMCFYFLIFL